MNVIAFVLSVPSGRVVCQDLAVTQGSVELTHGNESDVYKWSSK